MADQTPADDGIVELPETPVTPFPLVGEPATDQGFETAAGTKLRARLMKLASYDAAGIPTNTDVAIQPAGYNLSLTLAHLDDAGKVVVDDTGAHVISDRHELAITAEAMANPAFDMEQAVDTAIRQHAHRFESSIVNRSKAADYLSKSWGGAGLPTEAPPPIVFDKTIDFQPGVTVVEFVPMPPPKDAQPEMTAADIGVPEPAAS